MDSDKSGKLKLAIGLTSIILIAEIAGGIISNSLALLTDAAHVFMDIFALSLSFAAYSVACRPSNKNATFGYHRAEIFAALTNGLLLLVVVGFILMEAYERLISTPEIRTFEMMVFAIIGFVVNLYVAFKLRGHHDLNMRGAYLHVLGDTLSSVGVIIGGAIITLTGYNKIDPVISILIACIIVIGALRLIKESAEILMERTPKHIDVDILKNRLQSIDGVKRIHDLHIWSICSNVHALNVHLVVDSMNLEDVEKIRFEINKWLREDFNISHTTLQFECTDCGMDEIVNNHE
jgi:cobalt-zinc-cadmium efflux system protein